MLAEITKKRYGYCSNVCPRRYLKCECKAGNTEKGWFIRGQYPSAEKDLHWPLSRRLMFNSHDIGLGLIIAPFYFNVSNLCPVTYSNFQVGDRPPDPTDVLCFFHCVKRLFKRFFLKSSDCRLLNEGVALGDTDARGLDGATGHSMLITVNNLWKVTPYGR